MRNAGLSNSFRTATADQQEQSDRSPQRHSLAPEHAAALQQMQLLEQQLQARSNSPFPAQLQQSTSRSVSPQPMQYSSASAAVTEHMLQWQKHQQRRSQNSSTSPVRSGSAPLSLNGHSHLSSMPLYNPYQQMLLGGSYASAAGYMHHQPLHAAALLAAAAATAAPVAIPLPLPHAHHHSLAAAAAHTAAQQQYAAAAAARAVRGWSTASNGGSTASNSPISAPVRGGKGIVLLSLLSLLYSIKMH
jgi:hypothetical protein